MRVGFAAVLAVGFLIPVALAVGWTARDRPAAAPGAPAEVAPAAVPAGVASTFSGTTAQRRRIAFSLSADRRRLENLKVTYVAECLDSISMELDDELYAPVAVAADGSFSQRLGERIVLEGRIRGDRASGTLRIDMLYGALACESPTLRWSARA